MKLAMEYYTEYTQYSTVPYVWFFGLVKDTQTKMAVRLSLIWNRYRLASVNAFGSSFNILIANSEKKTGKTVIWDLIII